MYRDNKWEFEYRHYNLKGSYVTSIILPQNGLRSSPRKSISNSTDRWRRHENITNVSLSRCVSFYSGQSRAKDSSIFIHWNPDFLAFSGEELTNEQGYLGSLCASPFRLHNTVVSPKLRLISFQSFFKTLLALKTRKPRWRHLELRNKC